MQKVDKHISELLYDHDCVIVPDLGGFVTNYASAKIHPVQHTFTPPSKNIVFNVNLKTNDGLLANRIVTTEKTSYPEAINYITRFVDNANSELKNGTKVKIEEVGTLFLDVERNIQFEPITTNYLLQSFGLASFQSPAIKRGNIGTRIEKEFKDRGAIPAEKKKLNVKRLVALAVAVPLICGMLWIPMKTDLLKNINYSDLNPFANHESSKKQETRTIAIPPVTKKKPTPLPIVTETQPVVEPVKADSTAVVKASDVNLDFKFHLVAGCFAIENNAVKFVASLKEQNIDATIIGKNNKNLFVVSCGNYTTYKEANRDIANLRKQLSNVWLYKN